MRLVLRRRYPFFSENSEIGKKYGETAKKTILEKINYDYISAHINKVYREIAFEKRNGRDITAFDIFGDNKI